MRGVSVVRSAVVERMIDALTAGGPGQVETAMLRVFERVHFTIRRAFVDYQSACEERRRLAVDAGELSQQLTEALCAAGWSREAARTADVHQLAGAGAR